MKKRKKNNRLSFLTAIVCLLLFAGVLFLGMKNYEPEKSENPVQGVNSESSLKGYLGKGYAYAGSQEDASTGEESSFEEQAQILEDEPEEEPEKKKEELLIPAVKNPIRVFRELMELAEEKGIKVQSEHLKGYKSMLKNDRIAIRDDLSMNEVIFELAYELSHAIIHSNCGNMLESEKWREYHLRAIASAFMLIEALSIKVAWGKG